MTNKGFNEHRGTASRITFDHVTGQFLQTPVNHPFLAVMEAKVETESRVVVLPQRKRARLQRAILAASA